VAFKGRAPGGDPLTFGTTGRLVNSNLLMYDRQTESEWPQILGRAIDGEMKGASLEEVPLVWTRGELWKERGAEDAPALSTKTGYDRSYGKNPYAGYDDVDSSPFLYDGPETPGDLPPMARVIMVDTEEEAVAYPYEVLRESPAVNDVVNGEPVAVLWQKGTASALDEGSVDAGRDVGSAGVFSRRLDGRTLTFRSEESTILDEETGSEWTVLGEAVAGELEGKRLEPVVSIDHFWFSWAAFRPET